MFPSGVLHNLILLSFVSIARAPNRNCTAQVLGRHGHLVQMNAAGRQVAAERGWALVDFEAMAQWYAQPKVRPHPLPTARFHDKPTFKRGAAESVMVPWAMRPAPCCRTKDRV